jgi:hypothetical protein
VTFSTPTPVYVNHRAAKLEKISEAMREERMKTDAALREL